MSERCISRPMAVRKKSTVIRRSAPYLVASRRVASRRQRMGRIRFIANRYNQPSVRAKRQTRPPSHGQEAAAG